MSQNFVNIATYSEEDKKKTYLLEVKEEIENLLKLSENLDYAKYIQGHLYPVKYELERQFSLLDKTTQIN